MFHSTGALEVAAFRDGTGVEERTSSLFLSACTALANCIGKAVDLLWLRICTPRLSLGGVDLKLLTSQKH